MIQATVAARANTVRILDASNRPDQPKRPEHSKRPVYPVAA